MTNKPVNWTSRDDTMVEAAIRGGATRRDLLRMLMASGVGLAMGGTLLGSAGRALAQTPKMGGHMVIAGWASSTADTMDPAKAAYASDYIRCCATYSRLTTLNAAGEVEMELADEITTEDAKVWQIKLKSGVTFHDGKAFEAADVVFSLKRHLDPAVGSKVNAIAKQITDVTAVDPLTVAVTLSGANADLPTILALHHFMIVADGTTDFNAGNGTGAFKIEGFEPGMPSRHTKNENYFKNGQPYLDSFEFIAITDDTARLNALMAGEIHIAGALPARSVRVIEAGGGAVAQADSVGNYFDLNIRLDMDPGQKAGFVEGMKHLVDREAVLRSVLRGLGEIGNDQPVPPVNKYYNPNVKAREYDPERAKSLFDQAGVLGTQIPMIASETVTGSIDMATILQSAGSAIGLNIDVQRVPSDGYWSNYWTKAPVHFGSLNPRPTPDIWFSLLYQSEAPWNESHYKSEKFDSMLLEARGMLDDKLRTEIYWDMQQMVSDEAGTIIATRMSDVTGVSNKVGGWETNPLGGMVGYALAEKLWLEA